MTSLEEDMAVIANLEQPPDIQLIMVNKALTYGIIKTSYNETRFLWDIVKGLLYQIREDMNFLQHSNFRPAKDEQEVSFDLFFFETGNTVQVLSFKHNGEFQYMECVLPITNDKPKSLFISRDGSHLLAEQVNKAEGDEHKGATKPHGRDQSIRTNISRQKVRDQKSQYYQAQLEYEFGHLRVNWGKRIIWNIEEVVRNQAFREMKQQSNQNNRN